MQRLKSTPRSHESPDCWNTAPVVASSPPPTVSDTRAIPLLPMQHWYFESRDGKAARFNQAVVLRSATPLQTEPLRQALDDLVVRHEALRLRFSKTTAGGRAAMLVSPAEAAVHVGHWDRAFDVEAGPMMSAELITDEATSRLTLTAHHLLVDAVSWRTLVGDLEIAYRARSEGRVPAFADEAPSYVTWARAVAAFANTPAAEAEAVYWLTEDWHLAETALRAAAAPRQALSAVSPAVALAEAGALAKADVSEMVFDLTVEPMSGHETEAALLATLTLAMAPDASQRVLRVDLEGHGREWIPGADGSEVVGWCAALFPALLRVEGATAAEQAASVAKTLELSARKHKTKCILKTESELIVFSRRPLSASSQARKPDLRPSVT